MEDVLHALSYREDIPRFRDIVSTHQHAPCCGIGQAHHTTRYGGLSRSGLADDASDLTPPHREVGAFDCGDNSLRAEQTPLVVGLIQPDHFEDPRHDLQCPVTQRMIAMALILQPRILIADEPTTALDVTTQKQVLSLIRELQQEQGTAVVFVTHDFGVVSEIAERIVVMNRGDMVETGTREEILDAIPNRKNGQEKT